MKSPLRLILLAATLVTTFTYTITSAFAAPPVRIAVVSASGSGIEQEIVDRVTNSLSNTSDVVVSTVNPDWYIVCNITEQLDPNSGSIRYNGSVITKTAGGQVLNTVAVQKYNQDFSVRGSSQLNKKLVDNAARDVINSASNRVVAPIQNAVMVEMETRDRIIRAQNMADSDQYDDAIGLLRPITPDTTHFKDVRALIAEFEMEKDALERINGATARAAKGRYGEAIGLLKDVSSKSKRSKVARQKSAQYRAMLARGPKKPAR